MAANQNVIIGMKVENDSAKAAYDDMAKRNQRLEKEIRKSQKASGDFNTELGKGSGKAREMEGAFGGLGKAIAGALSVAAVARFFGAIDQEMKRLEQAAEGRRKSFAGVLAGTGDIMDPALVTSIRGRLDTVQRESEVPFGRVTSAFEAARGLGAGVDQSISLTDIAARHGLLEMPEQQMQATIELAAQRARMLGQVSAPDLTTALERSLAVTSGMGRGAPQISQAFQRFAAAGVLDDDPERVLDILQSAAIAGGPSGLRANVLDQAMTAAQRRGETMATPHGEIFKAPGIARAGLPDALEAILTGQVPASQLGALGVSPENQRLFGVIAAGMDDARGTLHGANLAAANLGIDAALGNVRAVYRQRARREAFETQQEDAITDFQIRRERESTKFRENFGVTGGAVAEGLATLGGMVDMVTPYILSEKYIAEPLRGRAARDWEMMQQDFNNAMQRLQISVDVTTPEGVDARATVQEMD